MFSVKFTCASVGEKAQTLRTTQFEGLNFKDGQKYLIVFANGKTAEARVTRNGQTLYIPAANFPKRLAKAEVGFPVSRKIKNIKKL